MPAAMLDRVIGRWLDRLKTRHGLHPANVIHDPMWDVRTGERSFLHIGCGHSHKQHTVPGFMGDDWREIRLDANPEVEPDVVANMTHMPEVPDGSVDAIYSAHNIEHLYPHEVPVAMAEFYRVLNPEGFLVVTCPDLQSLCQLVVNDKLDDPAYLSSAGPIAPIDVLYGHRQPMAAGNLFMAHHCGFTMRTLKAAAQAAGFVACQRTRRESRFDLWLFAHKLNLKNDELGRLAVDFLPDPG